MPSQPTQAPAGQSAWRRRRPARPACSGSLADSGVVAGPAICDHAETHKGIGGTMSNAPGGQDLTGRKLRLGVLGAGMIAIVPNGFLPGIGLLADRVEVVAITSRTRAR